MPVPLVKDPQMQFGAITFFAKEHKGDTCGSNGLPLTPNSIIIYGKAQFLKTIKHPYLCQYLDIIRGKHERTIVVSQYCGTPLSELIEKRHFEYNEIVKIAYQLLTALNHLHKKQIVHHNLSMENILFQDNNDIKLFNYGLYHMTGNGQLVSFPIVQILYSAPEIYLDLTNKIPTNFKADLWSVGMILLELVINKSLWSLNKLSQRVRKILSLIQCCNNNSSIVERIVREHNCYDVYQQIPDDFKTIIESCLNLYPKNRPTCDELLTKDLFNCYHLDNVVINGGNNNNNNNRSRICDDFEIFTINELYHWWQLAGGDVYQELKKQGLIRSSPPILSLPSLVLIEGSVLGQERNPATLYDPRIVKMPLESLYQRFSHIPFNCYYPLLHTTSKIIITANNPPQLPHDTTKLPLIIRERDPEYQFHRIILFRRLLHGYPFTRDLIVKEATNDIPPLLRGEIWMALLNIKHNYIKLYLHIDKETATITDRQIEVDIPRCHQYNEFLSSMDGHQKLKRILKAWIYQNQHQYVYWQGLDSLTAPFLYLNFNDEARAFACLSAFIPKYLHKFFLKDNSMVIQEYLAKFSQLIAFHDPILANHLYDINFYPELFAIPWFLTVFSHVFPLYKIMHLWDKLLLGDSSYPLHIGLSVLTQLRDRLLQSGFNECILLFSDLPEVDIEKCVEFSMDTFKTTPKSITDRQHQNPHYHQKTEFDISGVSLKELNKERCPRISATDFVDLIRNQSDNLQTIDIRNRSQFSRSRIRMSINIPFSSVSFNEAKLENIGHHYETLQQCKDKIIVIVGSEETDLELFPEFLLKCGVSKVCVLHGGFNILQNITPTILITSNQL